MKTMKATNISGRDLSIIVTPEGISVDQARIIRADLAAANGIIHVVDRVLAPTEGAMSPTAHKPKDHPAH